MGSWEQEITRRAGGPARRLIERAAALVFCTVGLGVRRLLWLLSAPSFLALRWLAPRLRCRLRANVAAALVGAGLVVLSYRWGAALDGWRWIALAGLLSLYGGLATLALQWPATLGEVQRANERWPIRWIARRLRNPLDGAIVRQSLQIGLTTLPGLVGIGLPWLFSPITLALFLIGACATVTTGDNVVHIMVHNKPFTARPGEGPVVRALVRAVHWYTVFVVLPACFHNYPFYIFQHNHNHHLENNGPKDTQTTLWYDRTSYLDFALYALRLAVTIVTAQDVLRYFARHGKWRLFRRLLAGMLAYYAVVAGIAVFNWRAAALCLLGRFFVHGVNQAGLGWYQHALFDPRDPTNDYTNSTNFAVPIEPFGAGLHGEHHVRMGRHWSGYTGAYRANPGYGGLIANELDPIFAHDFFRLLFGRQYARLGRLYSRGRERLSPAELERLVEERALPVLPDRRPAVVQGIDRALTLAAARLLIGRWAPR